MYCSTVVLYWLQIVKHINRHSTAMTSPIATITALSTVYVTATTTVPYPNRHQSIVMATKDWSVECVISSLSMSSGRAFALATGAAVDAAKMTPITGRCTLSEAIGNSSRMLMVRWLRTRVRERTLESTHQTSVFVHQQRNVQCHHHSNCNYPWKRILDFVGMRSLRRQIKVRLGIDIDWR